MAIYRIADHGESNYHIAVHQYSDETIRFAASELQKYILQATGTAIPYFSDRCPIQGPEIRLGAHVRDMTDDSSLAPEEFRIHGDGAHIYIEGGTSRAVLYGVYHFLECYCDFHCFTKDVETIGHTDVLEIDLTEIKLQPAFEYREAYFRFAFDGDFCAKNRLNSNMGDISKARGMRVKWYNFHHSFKDLVQPEKYFESHPEYFSEVDGKRTWHQLCLTNPDVLEIAKEKLLTWIHDNPECSVFSVAQNDNGGYCTCPACRALQEKEGSPSGPIIHFVNALADHIRDKYPHILLHTFAYQYSLRAPREVVARDNVIVRLCTISAHFNRPIAELAHEIPNGTEAVFFNALQDWKKHAKRLYVWDYAVNFHNYLQPFIHPHVLAENIKMYQQNGVMGVLEQGNFAYGGGASMDDLKSYLIARLLNNPQTDVDLEIHRFSEAVYGPGAAQYMEAYIRMAEEAGRSSLLGIYQYPDADYITDELVADCEKLFDLALKNADSDIYRHRIEREYLAVRYLRLTRLPMDIPDREKMIRVFFTDIKRHGITEIMERRSLADSQRAVTNSMYAKDRQGFHSLYYIMQ